MIFNPKHLLTGWNMSVKEIKEQIKLAFFEGYSSYETACAAYNTAQSAWEESHAKAIYDNLDNLNV